MRRAAASRLPVVLGLLGLAACAARVDPVREVAGTPDQVGERVAAGFRRLGLGQPQASADGSELGAELASARTAWARCRARLVSRGDDRRTMVTAGRRRGEVGVTLSPVAPAVTRVAVRTRYVGVYRNTATGYTFETPCESTGAVEEGLLEAAAGTRG